MIHRLIPKLFLTLLLVGCAHGESSKNAQTAHAAQRSPDDGAGRGEGKRRTGDEHAEHAQRRDREPAARDEPPNARGVRAGDGEDRAQASADAERDQNARAPTADEQGNDEIDVDLTQRIRKAVMHDDSLSFAAKNVQIITRDGHVTLRGRVKSSAEKEAIYQTALREAGAGRVSNQLEADQG